MFHRKTILPTDSDKVKSRLFYCNSWNYTTILLLFRLYANYISVVDTALMKWPS